MGKNERNDDQIIKFDYNIDSGLGVRANLGVIVLSSDQTLEYELRALLNFEGVVFYHSRIPNDMEITNHGLFKMEIEIQKVAALLPNSFNFSARLEIDYLNSKYNLNIPEGDYDTLGGFILHTQKNIPKKNEIISFEDFSIKILSISNNRIDNVFFRKIIR